MANVVRDPKKHPDAIIPDLNKSNPLVTFAPGDIAFPRSGEFTLRILDEVGRDAFGFLVSKAKVRHPGMENLHPLARKICSQLGALRCQQWP